MNIDSTIQRISLSCINKLYLIPYPACFDNFPLRCQYLSWLNDIDNLRLIASPALLTQNKPVSFVEESFTRFSKPASTGFFIYYRPNNTFIGTTKLDSYDHNTNSAFDGILIGDRNYHGKGLSKLTYTILLSFAFNHLKLSQVNGGCNDHNYAMKRTYQSLGYSETRRTSNTDCIDGRLTDHIYYSITRDQFLSTFVRQCQLDVNYSNQRCQPHEK